MTDPTERRRLRPEVEMVLHASQSRDDAMTALRGDVVTDMPHNLRRGMGRLA